MTGADDDVAARAHAAAAAWGWTDATLRPLAGGLINATFVVVRGAEPIAVLQRLHPVFAPEVNLDIDAITRAVAAAGVPTPRLIRTRSGEAWLGDGARSWRALTFEPGVAVARVPGPAWAEAGAALIARWHRAVDGLHHDYHFARAGVHDTAAHLHRLADGYARWRAGAIGPVADGDAAVLAEAGTLAAAIAAAAASLPPLPPVPPRHCHGDLKISNLLFTGGGAGTAPAGHCLVDLDTVGWAPLTFELGDAMRSWCNPHGEDAGAVGFELPLFAAAMRGYRDVAGRLDDAHRLAVVAGLHTVCIELAARFAADVFEDRYFGWDPARFPTRRAHNLVRARGQLALAAAVAAAWDDALALT